MKKICSMMIPLSLGIYLSSTTSLNASIQWLPDALEEGLKFSGFSSGGGGTDGGHGKGDGCDSKYNLSECPANGTCDRCAFANKYYLKECKSGYKISGNSCSAINCSAINASYLTTIPTNKICTKVTEGGLTCYKDCRNISCNGYSVNCDNIVNTTNITSSTVCPDCQSANANCPQKLCKITECNSGYKVNSDGSACVELDDTCPNGYYKSCSTETTGTPEYTEKGTACYQCKPEEPACSSSYKYDSSNCSTETQALCGSSCGGKYYSCVTRLKSYPRFGNNQTFEYYGWTVTNFRNWSNPEGSQQMVECPDYNANRDFYNAVESAGETFVGILPYLKGEYQSYGMQASAFACYSGERACLDVYLKLKKNKTVTLDKDINCGNLEFTLDSENSSNTYTINGNGHAITFDKPRDHAFYTRNNNSRFNINNTKIIFTNSNSSEYRDDICDSGTLTSSIFLGGTSSYDSYEGIFKLTNVDIYIDDNAQIDITTLNTIAFYGTNNIKIGKNNQTDSAIYSYITVGNIYGTVNLFLSERVNGTLKVDVCMKEGGLLNLKAEGKTTLKQKCGILYTKVPKNSKVNLCFMKDGTADIKEDSPQIRSNKKLDDKVTYVPDICDEDIFSGNFWQ